MCMLQNHDVTQAQPPEASEETFSSAQTAAAFMTRTKSVPSLSTIQSVKKSISEAGNRKGLLCQKCLVQLDWVATEDGSHLLTVGVGSKVLIYGQVSRLHLLILDILVNHGDRFNCDQFNCINVDII